ncbi:TonB-dependent receptor [Sphingomonas oleivorans]|uniref:TonB-dependent receptor n=1 Tax=Sphingomonas oleivorans TaxID=1735121 RepID=A0A2T5G369_9SPHN|nr:TonB-dependent receptor [Sphingomonas oleivorans]
MGCALFLIAAQSAAHAQQASADTQAETVNEAETADIVVTGFRAALASSIAEKRTSDLIVESVSAEDIGKLPDNSIAEAIARLPGLTAQRLDGRAQVISIRGLSPDFSTTLLNGREQVTTGDNRGVEFDQYPSEVIGQVVVYKTPEAGLIGQGLSGTVDLRTIRPLAYGKRVIAGNLRGEKLSLGKLNAGSKNKGFRASGTYVDQFADDRIGIAIGVAHLESPTQIERFNAWGYPTVETAKPPYCLTAAGVCTGPNLAYADAAGNHVIGGAKPYVVSTNLKRTGVIGTVQWEPVNAFTMTVDGYYSKFKDTQILRGIEFPLWWGDPYPQGAVDNPRVILQPNVTASNGLITNGTYTGVKGVVRNDANQRKSDLYALGWNGVYDQDGWKIMGDVSYSDVKRKDMIVETYAGTGRRGFGAADTVSFRQTGKGFAFDTALDYADPNIIKLTSSQGWGSDVIPGGQDGYYNQPIVNDELAAFRGEVERELGSWLKSIQIGANFTKRTKSLSYNQYFLGLKANADDPTHTTSVTIPSEYLLAPTELAYLGIPGMVSYDPLKLLNSGIYNLNRNPNADVLSANWKVKEDVLTGYAKLNLDADLGIGTLTGNAGVQIVYTDQSSDGFAASGAPAFAANPISDGDKYTKALPSLNLSLRMPDDFIVRLGLAREMARPRLDDMRSSINFGYNPANAGNTDISFSPWGGSGGNAKLRPWIADAADISVEKYFGRQAYVSLAGFYKNLKTYIYNQNQVYDFTGFPVSSGPEPVLRQGVVTTPQNGDGGKIYGAEGSVSLPFSVVAEMLDGFGALGSLSYTKSKITPDPNNPSQPLPGLSKYVWNGTLFFEKWGLSARASIRHRSKFLGEVAGFGASRKMREAKGETILDAQIGYEFKDGPLEGLSILAQGTNLTDEPFITYEGDDSRRVIDYQRFGRRYLLGVSYRY